MLHENPWFQVWQRGGYYTIEPQERQVIVLAVVAGAGVVMIRAKRPLLGDCPLELPAGGCHADEEVAEAAARELREETGIAVPDTDRFRTYMSITEDPNRTRVRVHAMRVDLAREEFAERLPHDDEVKGVQLVDFADLRELVMDGRVYVALPLAVLCKLFCEQPHRMDVQ